MSEELTEAELMTEIVRGDDNAFVELYRRRRDDVYRFAYLFARSSSVAQDVTQDVFLSVLENAPRYDTSKGSVRSWLLGSAKHLVIDRLRLERRWSGDIPNEQDTGCNGEEEVFRQQRLASLHAAISHLPFEFRDALILCELMELSYAESAAVMQCPVGTVRSRLHRARAMLAARLGGSLGAASRKADQPVIDGASSVPLTNSVR